MQSIVHSRSYKYMNKQPCRSMTKCFIYTVHINCSLCSGLTSANPTVPRPSSRTKVVTKQCSAAMQISWLLLLIISTTLIAADIINVTKWKLYEMKRNAANAKNCWDKVLVTAYVARRTNTNHYSSNSDNNHTVNNLMLNKQCAVIQRNAAW